MRQSREHLLSQREPARHHRCHASQSHTSGRHHRLIPAIRKNPRRPDREAYRNTVVKKWRSSIKTASNELMGLLGDRWPALANEKPRQAEVAGRGFGCRIVSTHYLRRRRRVPISPSRPRPASNSVDGSGTAVATFPKPVGAGIETSPAPFTLISNIPLPPPMSDQ